MTTRAVAAVALDELRRVFRSRWMAWTIAGICLTTATATWIGHRSLADSHASYLAAVQGKVEDQIRAKQPDGRNVDLGLRVIRPAPLGLRLVEGNERHWPSAWDFGPAGVVSQPGYDRLRSQLGGLSSWDLGYVVTVIGSLAALSAGFASIWAHRASGWVAAAAGRRLPRLMQAIGQLVGGQFVVGCMVAIWVTAALGSLWLLGAGESASQILQIAPVVWLFSAGFYSAGSAIASLVDSPARAWPIGMLLWAFSAAAGTALPTLGAHVVSPVVSPDVWFRQRADRFRDLTAERETAFVKRLIDALPTIPHVPDRDDAVALLFKRMDSDWQSDIREIRQAMGDLEEERAASLRQQRRVVSWLTAIVPAAAAYAVMSEIVGTGHSRLDAWEAAIRRHHRRLALALFDDRPLVNLRVPRGNGAQQHAFVRRQPGPQYADLPGFEPPSEDATGRRIRSAHIASLCVWWLAASVLAVVWRARLASLGASSQRS